MLSTPPYSFSSSRFSMAYTVSVASVMSAAVAMNAAHHTSQ